MVSYYVSLRLKQFLRFYSFSDIHPVIGVPVTIILFLFASALLFDKAPYPTWLYLAVTISAVAQLQSAKTNGFLKQRVSPSVFFQCKLAENAIMLLPFLAVMAYYRCWWQMLIAIAFILPYSRYSIGIAMPKLKAIPTPYMAYAFEFNLAFRTFFLVYIIYIVLLVTGGLVHNFYVFLVPFFLLLFFLQTAFGLIEEPYYIWVYRSSAAGFLFRKLKTICLSYGITILPFLALGAVFYYSELPAIFLCALIGLLAISGGMLIKYHFYPSTIVVQISQLLFFGFTIACVASPLMLPAVLLFMLFSFFRAKRNIKTMLQC